MNCLFESTNTYRVVHTSNPQFPIFRVLTDDEAFNESQFVIRYPNPFLGSEFGVLEIVLHVCHWGFTLFGDMCLVHHLGNSGYAGRRRKGFCPTQRRSHTFRHVEKLDYEILRYL